jgi:hypothetical protein
MAISLLAKISNLVLTGKKILFNNKSQIGDLVIDGTHLETITYNNTITTHPVESGAYIADHIYINPLRVTMDCSITDSAGDIVSGIREIGSLFSGNILNNLSNRFQGKGAKQTAAYEFLKDLAGSKSTVTIVNKLDVLPNMAVESVSMPRTKETGDRLYFTITLQQITYATVEKTTGLSKKYNLAGKLNLGKQDSKLASVEESSKAKSALVSILGIGK